MRIVFTVLYLVCTVNAMAQTMAGKVVDNNDNPVSFANVVLLNQADSAYLCGTVTDDNGRFRLNGSGGIIRVSSVGYKTFTRQYGSDTAIVVRLAEDNVVLNEVVVRGSLPKTRLTGEGMQTTVAGSVLEKAQTMEQLLDRIPNVRAGDGKVEVFGRGTPEIYINGRKLTDMAELETLLPEDVKNVSVITNPGARYAASVTSVIRITTKKRGEGFGVDTKWTARVNEKQRMSWIENTFLNYRKGALDVTAQLYGAYTHRQDDKTLTQDTYLSDTWRQTNRIEQENTTVNPYGRLAATYMLNDSNSVGISGSFDRYARSDTKGNIDTEVWRNGNGLERSAAYIDAPDHSSDIYANAYYVGKIGKAEIEFDADYYGSSGKEWMHNMSHTVSADNSTSATDVNSYRHTDSRLLASKLVASVPLLQGKFSIGGEYSHSKRTSIYNILPEDVIDDEDSKIKEGMDAVFAEYSRSFGKLYVQAGLRYEHVNFKYYDHGVYMDKQSKVYRNWLPTLTLSWPVGKTQMQLTYATDIHRPSYYSLREGVQYDTKYTYESGNPFLLPTVTRNIGYTFAWKWLTFTGMYSHVKDNICTIIQPYNGDPTIGWARPENIDSYDKMQFSLALSPTFGVWSPSLELGLKKQWFAFTANDGSSLDNLLGTLRLKNTLDLKWLTATLTMNMQSKGHDENLYMSKAQFCTNLAVTKPLLKNKLFIELYVYDLFGTADNRCIFYSGTQNVVNRRDFSTSTVSLSVRYKFNSNSREYKGSGAGSSQRNRM